jgi:hypothetical protein
MTARIIIASVARKEMSAQGLHVNSPSPHDLAIRVLYGATKSGARRVLAVDAFVLLASRVRSFARWLNHGQWGVLTTAGQR